MKTTVYDSYRLTSELTFPVSGISSKHAFLAHMVPYVALVCTLQSPYRQLQPINIAYADTVTMHYKLMVLRTNELTKEKIDLIRVALFHIHYRISSQEAAPYRIQCRNS